MVNVYLLGSRESGPLLEDATVVDAPPAGEHVRHRHRPPPAGARGARRRRSGVPRGARPGRAAGPDRRPSRLSRADRWLTGARDRGRLRGGLGAGGAAPARRAPRRSSSSSAASTSTTCSPPRPPARPTSRCSASTRPASTAPRSTTCAGTASGRSRSRPGAPRSTVAGCAPLGSASSGSSRTTTWPRCPAAVLAEESADTAVRVPAAGPAPAAAHGRSPVAGGRVVAVWGPGRRARAHHRRRRAGRRARPAPAAYRPRRRRPVRRRGRPAARHPRRGLRPALRGPAGRGRPARGAVRVGAARHRRPPERGHRAAPRRPVGRGAPGHRRAPPRGGPASRPRWSSTPGSASRTTPARTTAPGPAATS